MWKWAVLGHSRGIWTLRHCSPLAMRMNFSGCVVFWSIAHFLRRRLCERLLVIASILSLNVLVIIRRLLHFRLRVGQLVDPGVLLEIMDTLPGSLFQTFLVLVIQLNLNLWFAVSISHPLIRSLMILT